MSYNPYEFTIEGRGGTKPASPSRSLTPLRLIHLVLMVLQLGFWTWIIFDQRSSWERSGMLFAFFISMVAVFLFAVAADFLFIYGLIRKSEAYICLGSFVLCLLLAFLMAGSHSTTIIVLWLMFSAVWGSTSLARLMTVAGRKLPNTVTE